MAIGPPTLLVGVAVTFALQGALASLVGWLYVVTGRLHGVGDRIAIEDTRGDGAPSTSP